MLKNYDFVGNLKRALIISAAIMLVGVACLAIFGVKLDISFKGGTRIQYSYTEAPDLAQLEKTAEDVLGSDVEVVKDDSGDQKLVTLTLTKRISSEKQESLHERVAKDFKDSKLTLFNSNTLSACAMHCALSLCFCFTTFPVFKFCFLRIQFKANKRYSIWK